MKLSARNKLKGKITEVKKGATTTHVKIDVGGAVVEPVSSWTSLSSRSALPVWPACCRR
jgi:molybdopterin-binding protein